VTEEVYENIVHVLRQRIENMRDLLNATQASVSVPIIQRIAKKMQNNLFVPTITVAGNILCDGHHRYLAAVLIKTEIRTKPGELSRDQPIFELTNLDFQRSDWDKPADIERYMQEAADFYHRDLAEIRNLLCDSLIL